MIFHNTVCKSKRITQRRENKQRGRKNAGAWDTRFVPFCPAMKLSSPTKETLALFRNAGQYWQEILSPFPSTFSLFLSWRCLQSLRKEILILRRSTIVFAGVETRGYCAVSNFTLRCVFLEWDVHYPVLDAWWSNANSCRNPGKSWKERGNEFNDCEVQWRDDRVLLFFYFLSWRKGGVKMFYKLRKGIREDAR